MQRDSPYLVKSGAPPHGRTGGRPFVARESELAIAMGWLERIETGLGALVVGEAGIGKSRLLEELRARSRVPWVVGRCSPEAVAYLPLTHLVRELVGAQPIESIVAGWGDDQAAALLRFLLRVEPADAMDPLDRRHAIVEVIDALLRHVAHDAPLVVLVEDLHWIDEPSEHVLATLLDDPPPRVMFACTTRPEYRGALLEAIGDSRIALSTLADADASRIAAAVLRTQELAIDVQQRIQRVAHGNPFQIEEAARNLAEGAAIPASPDDMVVARVARIRKESRDALELASVIGSDFSYALLERTSQIQERLASILTHLQALEFVHQRTDATFAFNHQLMRDAAYGSLESEHKRLLHRQVGTAMEELYGNELEHVEALARHFEAAGDVRKALVYTLRAGQKAVADSAMRTGLSYFSRAMQLLDMIDDVDFESTVGAIVGHGTTAFILGELPEAAQDFERLRRVAVRAGDRALECSAILHHGAVAHFTHDFERSGALFREALARGADLPEVAEFANAALAFHSTDLGNLEEARRFLAGAPTPSTVREPFAALFAAFATGLLANTEGRFDDCIREFQPWPPVFDKLGLGGSIKNVLDRWAIAMPYAGRGEYNRALALLEEGLDTCERFGDALTLGRCLNTLGWIHGDLQDHVGALELNQRAVRVAEAAGDTEVLNQSRLNLGDSLFALGRIADADEQFAAVERVVRDPAPHERMMLWRYAQHLLHSRGELFLANGDYTRALEYADECLARATESRGKKNEVKARRLRAQIMTARGDFAPALREMNAAVALAEDLGNPPQLWKTLATRAELHAKQGAVEAARADFDAAFKILESVAAGLADPRLRTILLASPAAAAMRREVTTSVGAKPVPTTFEMRLEGDVWAITFAGTTVRVKDSRGMRLLEQLVARPDEELHVLLLVNGSAAGDAFEVIDRRAMTAYKARSEALRDELDEAERFNDSARATRAREELDALAGELARGVGLGGRLRKSGSAAERARVNVQRRLRGAIERVTDVHAKAGDYLGRSIRTGTFCSYSPPR